MKGLAALFGFGVAVREAAKPVVIGGPYSISYWVGSAGDPWPPSPIGDELPWPPLPITDEQLADASMAAVDQCVERWRRLLEVRHA